MLKAGLRLARAIAELGYRALYALLVSTYAFLLLWPWRHSPVFTHAIAELICIPGSVCPVTTGHMINYGPVLCVVVKG